MLGAGGRPLLPAPVLALLLLELLAESCFFFELLNFTLPESVNFNFPNNLLIGLSMMKPSTVFLFFSFYPVWAKSKPTASPLSYRLMCSNTVWVDIQQNTDVQVDLQLSQRQFYTTDFKLYNGKFLKTGLETSSKLNMDPLIYNIYINKHNKYRTDK